MANDERPEYGFVVKVEDPERTHTVQVTALNEDGSRGRTYTMREDETIGDLLRRLHDGES